MEAATGMKIRIQPLDIIAAQARIIKKGEALCVPGSIAMVEKMQTGPEFASKEGGPWNVRIFWSLGVTSLPFWVRGDSNIKTTADIKPGIKWGAVKAEPPYMETFYAFFAWCGLDVKDTMAVPFATWPEAINAINTRKVDVVYGGLSIPALIEANAGVSGGLRPLEMNPQKDPEAADRFWAVKPTMGFAPVPGGPIKQALGVWGPAVLTVYAARAEADSELIYHMVQWLGENYDIYKDKHDYCRMMSVQSVSNILPSCFFPWHDGAIKYLKEKKIWSAANDARQKKNTALVERYVKAYDMAIAEADKKGIKVDPTNKEWLDLWGGFKKDLPKFGLK
jgi:TRAP-type uncharacterized transport system substrate-binding protein